MRGSLSAKLFLHDLQRGDAQLLEGHTFRDYINTYKDNAENAQLNAVVNAFGLDKGLLIALMADSVNDKNLNDFGRFDALKETVDKAKEGANKRGNSSRLTQSFHFFMFEPIFSPVNASNQPI